MSVSRSALILATALGLGLSGMAVAQNVDGAIKARQSHMGLYAFNLGPLGAMARGDMPYDAAVASAAAANLAALTSMDQMRYWPEGSDSESNAASKTLPALWQNIPDVMTKAVALNEAVSALNAAAGTDLASLQGAMGAVGGACGACHQAYRVPQQ